MLCLSGYCDTLDGTVARFQQHSTPAGTVLDIVADRIVECAIVIGLFSLMPQTRGFDCLIMLGSMYLCITTFLVVGIFTENSSQKSFHYSPGIMERAEAFVFFIAMILFSAHFSVLAWLYSLLVLVTAIIRTTQFIRNQQGNTAS